MSVLWRPVSKYVLYVSFLRKGVYFFNFILSIYSIEYVPFRTNYIVFLFVFYWIVFSRVFLPSFLSSNNNNSTTTAEEESSLDDNDDDDDDDEDDEDDRIG